MSQNKVTLTGRQAQCVLCGLVFTSDNGCEKHKSYNGRGGKATCVHPSTIGMVERERGWTTPLPESAMPWKEGAAPVYVPAGPQVLTCESCGIVWERPAIRGRKPKKCEACRNEGLIDAGGMVFVV